MSTTLFSLVILSGLSVVIVLMLGIFSMIKGGEFNEKYGNKLMRLRIILQAMAIFFLALAATMPQN